MNYRHAFHAGNFADVVKHAVLCLLVAHLKAKEAAFSVLDSHAGAGLYDLEADSAARTGEARGGVLAVLAAPDEPLLAPYRALVLAANPGGGLRYYPGSPMLVRGLLRPQDRLVAIEKHPDDGRALRRLFAGDRQVAVHRGDGYAAVKALLPPKERRGLVLIDPPYEEADEFPRILRALADGLARWAAGIFAVWYPIKDPELPRRFLEEVGALGRPALAAELLIRPASDPARLNGCGMAIVNPPWRSDAALAELFPALGRALGARGGFDVRNLGNTG